MCENISEHVGEKIGENMVKSWWKKKNPRMAADFCTDKRARFFTECGGTNGETYFFTYACLHVFTRGAAIQMNSWLPP